MTVRVYSREGKEKFEQHVLDFYNVEDLRADANAAGYGCMTTYQKGFKMVQGGCFLISYYDQNEFFKECGFTKSKNNDDTFDRYAHGIALAIERILK